MKYNNYSFTTESAGYYDEGLRVFMLSIYRNISTALGISGLVAYIVGSNTVHKILYALACFKFINMG